jgi:1-aminocyclopropane-1-carboxylate deaminase/D-cysteine desulfhydrase-like pyridoxal-dependent ACC family enzyme
VSDLGVEVEQAYGAGATSIFDPVLCELVYRWFSPPGGLVLDPFAGGSVRGIVASKLGRRYLGIDVRQEQIEANRVQAERICADGVAFVPDVPEDHMPEVTPVERHGPVWMKREDHYAFGGVRGAKVRTCMLLVERAREQGVGVVTAGSRQSPQVNFVAQIAAAVGVKCRAHVPSGELTAELVAAKSAGAEVIQHEAGYNTVIVARAREDAQKLGWVEIPYGMESPEAVTFTKPQVVNVPDGAKRLVNAVGSGMTLAGILWGLVESGRDLPVVGVCVGHPPIERLNRHAPPGWQDMVELIEVSSDYHEAAKQTVYEGVLLDPWYEAKCIPYLQADDLLWVSAIRPSAVPGVAPMPEWVTGDAADVTDLCPGVEADLWFSCPPYGDLEVYSDDPRDLSTMSDREFREQYRRIIRDSTALLRDDRFAVIVVGDYRGSDGFYRNFVSNTIEAFQAAGLGLYNEAVLVTNLASLILRVGKQFDVSRKLGKSHQNVLVFVKGDPRKATLACGPVQTGDFGDLEDDE